MPSSPIRKLVGAAREAEKRGKTVYRLNIGQPDVPTPPQAIEALRISTGPCWNTPLPRASSP